MKLYRNHYRDDEAVSRGYSWHLSIHDAEATAKRYMETNGDDHEVDSLAEAFDLALTTQDVVDFLNRFSTYPDNG